MKQDFHQHKIPGRGKCNLQPEDETKESIEEIVFSFFCVKKIYSTFFDLRVYMSIYFTLIPAPHAMTVTMF